jgi:hypothetical protein
MHDKSKFSASNLLFLMKEKAKYFLLTKTGQLNLQYSRLVFHMSKSVETNSSSQLYEKIVKTYNFI